MRFDVVHPSAAPPVPPLHVPQIPQIIRDPHAIALMWNVIYMLIFLAAFVWLSCRLAATYSRRNNPLIQYAIKNLDIK